MENISFSEINIGPKELKIGSAWLGEKLIVEANQESVYINRWENGDQDLSFGSHKSGNEMSADFWRNADEKLEWNHHDPSESYAHTLPGPGWATATSAT